MNFLKRTGCAGAILGLALNTQAASLSMPVKYRLPVIEDGVRNYERRTSHYNFRVEVISDDAGLKPESWKNGRPFISAEKGERYAIVLHNPLPVRVAVNLSVDGLNTITGKPSGIADGSKWMIDAYSSITIRGWQVNDGEARRFYFTEKPASYAAWRGEILHKDLAANCGVIGAAFFWNKRELSDYFESNPIYRQSAAQKPQPYSLKKYSEDDKGTGSGSGRLSERANSPAAEAAGQRPRRLSSLMDDAEAKREEAPKEKAGTGMGERESHFTTEVAFKYDAGMYKTSQAVLIYYDFARAPEPNPFPAISFAPEMP